MFSHHWLTFLEEFYHYPLLFCGSVPDFNSIDTNIYFLIPFLFV